MTQEDLIKQCVKEYRSNLNLYQKMKDYYISKTDAMKNYKMVTSRTNNKINVNFIKRFIKEEVSYILGNKLTYISRSGNTEIIDQTTKNIAHWSEKHDQELCKNMLKFSMAYELYYIDDDGQFSSKVLTPLNSYAYTNDKGKVEMFFNFFQPKFSKRKFVDIYFNDRIDHYDISDGLIKIGETKHVFGEVPVSIAVLSEEQEYDTLYSDLRSLQDAYETNLSDISNEISDFRQAYLVLTGVDIDDEDLPKMKELGALKIPTTDAEISWLIKNVNDAFIQNTLQTIETKMFQLSSHIDQNEKLQSNSSSLALRTRLIALENKCKLNQNAIADAVKNRIRILYKYLKIKYGSEYDYRDIKIKFSVLIPSDDLVTAQILAQLGDKLSTSTGISQLSFIENPDEELKKIQLERENNMIDLDNVTV